MNTRSEATQSVMAAKLTILPTTEGVSLVSSWWS